MKLPLRIDALKTAVYILNRVLTKAVSKIPFELFKGRKPSLRHICIWGCPSEVRTYNPQEKKLDPRTISGYFIGYAVHHIPLGLVENLLRSRTENRKALFQLRPQGLETRG